MRVKADMVRWNRPPIIESTGNHVYGAEVILRDGCAYYICYGGARYSHKVTVNHPAPGLGLVFTLPGRSPFIFRVIAVSTQN